MTPSRRPTESGARPSNAGDRYHFVYVARRLLDLLHPYSGLTQVVIENVSPADAAAQPDPAVLQGVDVSEYYGGEDVTTATAVDLVQVKYSPLRPDQAWTRSRLTERKGRGSSVFRKLTAMFDTLAPSAGTPARRALVRIRLLTNQLLDSQLRQDLEKLQVMIEAKGPPATVRALIAVDGRARETAKALKMASRLSWPRFGEFLATWDLDAFGHPSLGRSEAELFEALSGFSRDGSERLDVLLSTLQLSATPGQRGIFRRREALALLRLTEDAFYPAPSLFLDQELLFETRSVIEVRKAIEQGDGRVVVHGRSGSGKTSALRLALESRAGQGKAVLYDCFADGQGLLLGNERFPYKKCFTQVVNELDARYRTSILATVGLDYQGLMRQLRRSLEAAAKAAEHQRHRLVLAFDAIDNASEQKRRASADAGESFVPMLWRLDLPKNCTLVVSLRTENRPDVVADNIPDARLVKVRGFDEEETQHHAELLAPSLPLEEVRFLHERTAGNPRVQSKLLREIALKPPEDARRLIDETARRTAFEDYDQESEKRLATPDVRRLLAVLYEMRQAPRLTDVSAITGLPEQELHGFIAGLSFGLRLQSGDRVGWENQDFLDWTGARLDQERVTARAALADHCIRAFDHDEYARWNLSYHLLQADRLDELVAWWREPGHLDGQLLAAHPHEERVLDDLRAAILGALRIGQTREAFDLLLRAADIAEGRDAFTEALAKYPDVAVATDLAHLLPGGPEHEGEPTEVGTTAESILTIAAELARRPECREAAKCSYARFEVAKEAERVRVPEHGGGLNRDEVPLYARYLARVDGFQAALGILQEEEPSFWSRLFIYTVGSEWQAPQAPSDIGPLGVLSLDLLDPGEEAAASLGVLSASDSEKPRGTALRMLDRAGVETAAKVVAQALSPGSSYPASVLQEDSDEDATTHRSGWVVYAHADAIENLASVGYLEAARDVLAVWSPPQPRHRFAEGLELYLRWAALREALTNVIFDPASYELPPRPSSSGADDSSERDAIRREMALGYPPLRVRALAWAGAPTEELSTETRRQASSWMRARSYLGSEEVWSFDRRAAILLEAILAFPGNHIPLAREVIEAAGNALGDDRELAQVAGASVLSRDERYLREAEHLIRKLLDRCRPPKLPARVAMERLLSIYKPAARISASLARRVMVAAREAASEIDSRIFARAEAITAIAELALLDLDSRHLDELCAVTAYWWSVNVESSQNAGKTALGLLAQKDPGAALKRAWDLDQHGLLDFEDGLGHMAAGALASTSLLPEMVWPILPLLTNSNLLNTVARNSIELLYGRGLPLESALGVYCRLARLGAASHRPVTEASKDVVAWAQSTGLGFSPEIQATQAFAVSLETALAEEKSARRAVQNDGLARVGTGLALVDPSPLAKALAEQIPHAPRMALKRLEEATAEELKGITSMGLPGLVSSFLDSLPLSDRPRLAAVIESWGAMKGGYYAAKALSLLDSLLEGGGTQEPDLVRAVGESLSRLLTADCLTSLAHPAHRDDLTILLQVRWDTSSARLATILDAVARHLRELGSDALFSLAAHTAAFLKSTDLTVVAQDFIARTTAEVPNLVDPAVPGEEPVRVIPSALTLALGHPRQALRWRGAYAIVHALVDTDEPKRFFDPLLDALDSKACPRWLSVRKWLAFALEHVALRKPGVLRNIVGRLIPHVISRELPHAKIRHHLKQVLLAIEQNFPDSLSEEDLARVERINRPVAIIQERPIQSTIGRGDQELSLLEKEDRNRIVPDSMDTLPYWYRPLAECFTGDDIESIVVRRATDWMARLGVTRRAVEAEELLVRDRYDGKSTYNDHGSQPQVELLQLYGERHGLYLAAGELIDSVPVLESRWADGARNEWDDWARYHLRGADPGLPARLIEAPPPLADNYGVFSSSVDDWKRKEEPAAFSRELEVPGEAEWIVVAGYRRGFEYDRSFSVWVDSALVSPGTARALARLLESGSREVYLPVIKLREDCILPDLEDEDEIVEAASRLEDVQQDHKAGDGRFFLEAWTARFCQEAPLHDLDPWWPGNGRNYALPAVDVVRQLGLVRHPAELLWRDATGRCVARCDLWRRSDGSGGRSVEGHRLVMRRDIVATYVGGVGLDVVFAVRLSREGRSDYGSRGRKDYDPGTTR